MKCIFAVVPYPKEILCGKEARYRMVSGTKHGGLCKEHAEYEKSLGYEVTELDGYSDEELFWRQFD